MTRKIKRPRQNNALTHGLYATEVTLPWERKEDFLELFHGLCEELHPDGVMEREAVFDLAHLHLKRRRLLRAMQIRHHRNPLAIELEKRGLTEWSEIRKYLHQQARKDVSILEATDRNVDRLRDMLAKVVREVEGRVDTDLAEPSDLEEDVGTLTRFLEKRIVPLRAELAERHSAEKAFDGAYEPDLLEQDLKLGEMIDRQIGKALARLTYLKEYKRMYPPPAVEPPPPALPKPKKQFMDLEGWDDAELTEQMEPSTPEADSEKVGKSEE